MKNEVTLFSDFYEAYYNVKLYILSDLCRLLLVFQLWVILFDLFWIISVL